MASRADGRLVLHPAAHDEAPIRMAMFGRAFTAARGLAFYTDAERRTLGRLWPQIAGAHQLVVGLGVDTGNGAGADPATFRASSVIGDRPYLLCLGRVDDGKGARSLGRFFAAFKRRHPGPLALVFAGPVVHPPDPHPDVFVTGALSETDKWSALAGCEAFVQPSANESFSIVLLEAWVASRPALVNARCGPTSEHARRSGAGLAFGGYAGFETALTRILGDPRLVRAMGDAGRAYVERSFTWPVVTARYRRWLEGLAGRGSTNLVRP
jgi:glycosyltransferase involved in cell wall biosynthesis